MAELITVTVTLATLTTLGPGALAPADPGCLERVEMARLQNGWGLARLGGPGVMRVAIEDCGLLGWRGVAVIEDYGTVPVFVVDCQQAAHQPLSERGLVADVSWEDMGHRQAVLILVPDEVSHLDAEMGR